MKKLCIIGVGGTATDLLSLVETLNPTLPTAEQWECIGFLDDNAALNNGSFHGFPVLGALSDAALVDQDVFFAFTIGSPRTAGKREKIFRKTEIGSQRFPSFVHPQAAVPAGWRPGHGTLISPGVVVSRSAVIGDFVVVLPNSVVSHDSRVGGFSCLATGVCVSGGVTIGEDAYIGANAALRDGVSVGKGVLVGLGSAVVSDIEDGLVVCGVPAKPLAGRNQR